MSLNVETGTGSSSSESYASVANADTYHTNYGNEDWDLLTTAAKEIALRKATRFLDAKYGRRWLGSRSYENQALNWPRSYVEDPDGFYLSGSAIPQALKDATSIMALAASAEDIYPDVEADDGAIKRAKVVVGPIEIEDEFTGSAFTVKMYRLAEDVLSRYITSGGTVSRG